MKPDFQSLVGHPLRSTEKKDYSWIFAFSDHANITTETSWRFITPEGIVVTSDDHEQWFGLTQPVDAGQKIMSESEGLLVTAVSIHDATGDLAIRFGSCELQFLQTSSGYEAWTLQVGGTQIVCTGGGQLAFFADQEPRS